MALLNVPCSMRSSGRSQQPMQSATWEDIPGEKQAQPPDVALNLGPRGTAVLSSSSTTGPAPTSSHAVAVPFHRDSQGAPGSGSSRSGRWQAGQVAAAAPLGALQTTRASSSGGQQRQSGSGSSVHSVLSDATPQKGHMGTVADLEPGVHSEEQPSAYNFAAGVSQQPAAEGSRTTPSADGENVSPNRWAAGRRPAAGKPAMPGAAGLGRSAHQMHSAGSASGSLQAPEGAGRSGQALKGAGSEAGQLPARSAAGSAAHAGLQRSSGLQGVSSETGRRSREKLSGIVSFLDQLEAQVSCEGRSACWGTAAGIALWTA